MGVAMSMYNANWPPKAKWSVNDIPDLSGKVAIVTGGNSGIGKETVKALLAKKAKVYIAAHNQARCDAAIQELKTLTSNEALFLDLDLADLSAVKRAAQAFQEKESKLDILINNAGVMLPDPKALTVEGYDLQFGVNVIGHWYFTQLLIPQLVAAGSSRLVNVSSHGHILSEGINWNTLRDGPERQKTKPLDLYNQSKFANVAVASEFARRYADKGIVSTSLHPGLIVTNLGRDMSRNVVKIVGLLSYDSAKGALTSLYAATSPEAATANGKASLRRQYIVLLLTVLLSQYLIPWARIGKAHPGTLNPELGEKLWTWLEEQTKDVK
ncbi:hypothetical protein EIP86_006700 [Pleurotus ostreatoroseus]|nr:hypothetical protein EIP86_006700 [Pleurotus ostreatoroseus]